MALSIPLTPGQPCMQAPTPQLLDQPDMDLGQAIGPNSGFCSLTNLELDFPGFAELATAADESHISCTGFLEEPDAPVMKAPPKAVPTPDHSPSSKSKDFQGSSNPTTPRTPSGPGDCVKLASQFAQRDAGKVPAHFSKVPIVEGKLYETFEQRYLAMLAHRKDADKHFLCCTKSTKICCLPSCISKLPSREQVMFINGCGNEAWEEAKALEYRACQRCKPDLREDQKKDKCQVHVYLAGLLREAEHKLLFGDSSSTTLGNHASSSECSPFHLTRTASKDLGNVPLTLMLKWHQAQLALQAARHKDNILYQGIDWSRVDLFSERQRIHRVVRSITVDEIHDGLPGRDVYYVTVDHAYLQKACVLFCADVKWSKQASQEHGKSSEELPVSAEDSADGLDEEQAEAEDQADDGQASARPAKRQKCEKTQASSIYRPLEAPGQMRPAILGTFVGVDAVKEAQAFAPDCRRDQTFEPWLANVVDMMHFMSANEAKLLPEQMELMRRARLFYEAVRYFVPCALTAAEGGKGLEDRLPKTKPKKKGTQAKGKAKAKAPVEATLPLPSTSTPISGASAPAQQQASAGQPFDFEAILCASGIDMNAQMCVQPPAVNAQQASSSDFFIPGLLDMNAGPVLPELGGSNSFATMGDANIPYVPHVTDHVTDQIDFKAGDPAQQVDADVAASVQQFAQQCTMPQIEDIMAAYVIHPDDDILVN